MNNEVIKYVNNLPIEVIQLIKEFLPNICLVFTSRQNYLLYHSVIKKYIKNYYNYIRNIIRHDYHFVFEKIVEENYEKWKLIKKYQYNNMIFKDYNFFIMNYCIENESTKCYQVISDFLKKHGLCKNLHKKNIVKHIRWKN
jgi:hypothetical protein